MTTHKVAIIGAGYVGATIAYALYIDGVSSEICLIDINKEKAEGEALDLVHGALFTSSTKITFGDKYRLCRGADIVVITAGAHQKPGETRLDLIRKNSSIVQNIVQNIVKHNNKCIILLITNPLDVLVYLGLKISGFPPNRVLGSGTILDTARFRHNLARYYGVTPSSIHAYILGEHGDSEFPVWSSANIAGIRLRDFERYDQKKLDAIFLKTKNAAYEIIAKKGATYYAIGLAATKIIRTILTDQHAVLPVSCLLEDYYGISDVCLSVPAVIGRKGVLKKIPLHLNYKEKKQLQSSAKILKSYIQKLDALS